jgi:hypothetical protein
MASQNTLQSEDKPVHDWYRFVLSFPPHLVRNYLSKFGAEKNQVVLDPFCGTGTTPVECKKMGLESIGIESHPFLRFAASTKIDWSVDSEILLRASNLVVEMAKDLFMSSQGLRTLPDEIIKLLPKGSISSLPLHKTLILLEAIEEQGQTLLLDYQRLALAKCLPQAIGNLRFGPEVYVGKPLQDAPVFEVWRESIEIIAKDVLLFSQQKTKASIYQGDARHLSTLLLPKSVDYIFCSPPYANEKDYTRTTRLESVLLGFIKSRADLRAVKERLLRSNTRNVFKNDEDGGILDFQSIRGIVDEIETRRVALGKTSGFEKAYSKVVRFYFSGMRQHLADLRTALRPGACLAYVVGDQASFFRVKIETARLLAEIAESLGYQVLGIDLFRKRLSTVTREQLREEVLILRWNE